MSLQLQECTVSGGPAAGLRDGAEATVRKPGARATVTSEQVLDALARHELEHGFFPTYRQLGHLLGFTSSSAAVPWIARLEEAELITKRPRQASLRVAKLTPLGHQRLQAWREGRRR